MQTTEWICLGLLAFAMPIGVAQADSTADQVDALEHRIESMEKRHEEELRGLREEIEALKRKTDEIAVTGPAPAPAVEAEVVQEAPPSAIGQSALSLINALNPAITAFGNFTGRVDSDTVRNESGDEVDNRFNLREVEIDFRAAIDAWADGVIIVALESDTPGEFEVGVEEGYATLKKLPILDTAPLGLRLTFGRFRPEFGRFNKIHTHDLPQTTRPRSMQTFLGQEGYIQDGVNAEFNIPTPGDNNALSASTSVLNGGDIPVGEGNDGEDLSFVGHLKWFWDLGAGHDLEIGSSIYSGHADTDGELESRLYGADFTYKWKPFRQGEWHSFLLGGEFYSADLDEAAGGSSSPLGYFVWSQYQLSRNAYIGARYDFTEELDDEDAQTDTYSTFWTYYTTEFLRLRLGYEHTESDVAELDGLNTGWFELNFVFGSHPVEPYWVNR